MPTGRTVRVRLEFDELVTTFMLDTERAATVLRAALSVANLEHLIQRDSRFSRRPQLLHLAKEIVHLVVDRVPGTWVATVQELAGLDYQQADGDRAGCVWSVMGTGRKGVV